MCVRGNDRIKFKCGTLVPRHDESKYLGCMLNDKGDPKREINKRIAECYTTWKKLAEFWKHSNCSVKLKLGVYDAVIRTKLVYGLESVQVNDSLKQKIDAFQLKGLRQILRIQTTYVDRANTNEHVFDTANRAINENRGRGRTPKYIIPISEYYESQRRKFIIEIITTENEDPITSICIDKETLKLNSYNSRRVGRPRNNWWTQAIANYWNYLRQTGYISIMEEDFNWTNEQHIQTDAAYNGI